MLSFFKPFLGNNKHDYDMYIKQQEQYHKNQLKKLEKMKKIEYKPLKLPTNSNSYHYSSSMISDGNNWKLYTNDNGNKYFEQKIDGKYTQSKDNKLFNPTYVIPNTELEYSFY